MSQDKKNKAITEAVRAIHKQFGSGSIMRLDGGEVPAVDVIPTGSVALDVALGCGGLPRGRIIEIYGPESSGKTTLTLHAIAEAQRAGGVCAFIDAEHALDTDYARRLGVDLEDLLVSQPDCGEQALEICDTLVRTGVIALFFLSWDMRRPLPQGVPRASCREDRRVFACPVRCVRWSVLDVRWTDERLGEPSSAAGATGPAEPVEAAELGLGYPVESQRQLLRGGSQRTRPG